MYEHRYALVNHVKNNKQIVRMNYTLSKQVTNKLFI